MYINPGKLRQKIKIVSENTSKDESGYPIPESTTIIHETFAQITNTSGTEINKSQAEFSEVKTRFFIRYTSKSLTNKMKIIFRNSEYEILYINEYENSKEYIEIFTKKLEMV